jgi:pimeloyl-ACP methyl ester carboxylesterase
VKEIVRGGAFDHTLYRRPGEASAPVLHVYFGGDGSPAQAIRHRPPDPTPDASLMLGLMALDPSPSVYLGRPCHHGLGPCHPELWTLARYGEEVVESMAAATRALARRVGAREVVVLGYSGGGTLAMLVAERVPETRAVVTIAANLDVEAWARYHGYQPLRSSLDPARRPPLRPEVRQIHLAGGRDSRVPAELARPVAVRQAGARWLLLPDFDHSCCWERVWPWLLGELVR